MRANKYIFKYLDANYTIIHRAVYCNDGLARSNNNCPPIAAWGLMLDVMLVFGLEYKESKESLLTWTVMNGVNYRDLKYDFGFDNALEGLGLSDELSIEGDGKLTEAEYNNIRTRLNVTNEDIDAIITKMNNNRVTMIDFYRNEGFLIR